jgi:hypothetical protein
MMAKIAGIIAQVALATAHGVEEKRAAGLIFLIIRAHVKPPCSKIYTRIATRVWH